MKHKTGKKHKPGKPYIPTKEEMAQMKLVKEATLAFLWFLKDLD